MTPLIVFAVIIVGFALINRLASRGIAQVDAETARNLAEKAGAAVLDVRTPREFGNGHIEGAVLVPLAEIRNRIGELAHMKDKPVLVYCLTGNRSMTASRLLRKNGFARICNLRGGINAWTGKGFTIVKGP